MEDRRAFYESGVVGQLRRYPFESRCADILFSPDHSIAWICEESERRLQSYFGMKRVVALLFRGRLKHREGVIRAAQR